MSRWIIEKNGTGIEKSGTGIEKSGTGLSEAGTHIEKAGTGIEKSGTGIRRGLLAISLAALVSAGNVSARQADPAGSLQVVVQNNTIAVSWIIGDSVFSGVSRLSGSYANLMLTEVALSDPSLSIEVTGGGTGANGKVTGGGTGRDLMVTGGGTGALVTGGGTGALVTGGGTGSTILVTGGGTGVDSISITLPDGTGMNMEISLGCDSASVTIVDSDSAPIITFENVQIIGESEFCQNNGFDSDFSAMPGADFYAD